MSKEDIRDIALKLIREEMRSVGDVYGCDDELIVLREVCAYVRGVLEYEREVMQNGQNS